MTTYGATFQISALQPPFFQRRAEHLVLVLHRTQVLATGELIFMLENLIKGDFHAMGPIMQHSREHSVSVPSLFGCPEKVLVREY